MAELTGPFGVDWVTVAVLALSIALVGRDLPSPRVAGVLLLPALAALVLGAVTSVVVGESPGIAWWSATSGPCPARTGSSLDLVRAR